MPRGAEQEDEQHQAQDEGHRRDNDELVAAVVDQLRPVQADEGVGVVAVGGLAENVALDDDVVGGCDGVASAAGVAVVFGDDEVFAAQVQIWDAVRLLGVPLVVRAVKPVEQDFAGVLVAQDEAERAVKAAAVLRVVRIVTVVQTLEGLVQLGIAHAGQQTFAQRVGTACVAARVGHHAHAYERADEHDAHNSEQEHRHGLCSEAAFKFAHVLPLSIL